MSDVTKTEPASEPATITREVPYLSLPIDFRDAFGILRHTHGGVPDDQLVAEVTCRSDGSPIAILRLKRKEDG